MQRQNGKKWNMIWENVKHFCRFKQVHAWLRNVMYIEMNQFPFNSYRVTFVWCVKCINMSWNYKSILKRGWKQQPKKLKITNCNFAKLVQSIWKKKWYAIEKTFLYCKVHKLHQGVQGRKMALTHVEERTLANSLKTGTIWGFSLRK